VIYLIRSFPVSVQQPRVVTLLLEEGGTGAQFVEVHEVSQFAATLVSVAVAVAANWAVEEILGGIGCAGGCIEVSADDGCGVRWAFPYNFV
jgi:hypothetical protein